MKSGVFDKKAFIQSVRDNLKNLYRKTLEEADQQEIFQAVSFAVKDVINDRWLATQQVFDKEDPKIVYYMSMEFLMGRALGNNLINLKEYKEVREALDEIGLNLDVIEDQEPDPALGNGGLGRLAACFMDSLSTLGYAAYGCGIRYRYGMFKQKIQDGFQVEVPDNWLKNGYPFELHRPEYTYEIKFGGHVRTESREDGSLRFVQEDYQSVLAIPYDMPVVGYGNNVVNTLMIWDAAAKDYFELDSFDKGDYQKAVEQQNLARNLVEVLYPNDNHVAGKELRLKQQYFFVSASVQRALARYKKNHDDIRRLPEKVTFQLNDTHPTVTVAELMRILVDEEGLGWDEAWEITTKTCAYTNHTIMAEALEKWPIEIFQRLLPRIYQIVDEINRRFVLQIQERYPGDDGKVARMAILYDGQVKMAHLAIAAGYSVNGVARLHTEILKNEQLHDFYEMFPEKFNNKTNGISHRRFFAEANPTYAKLVTEAIGDGWLKDAFELEKLKEFQNDTEFLKAVGASKRANKERLAAYVKAETGLVIDPNTVFDVQVKRFHAYKRQLMNIMKVMDIYNRRIADPNFHVTPTTFIFSGKAASSYTFAKETIRLINSVADVINNDPRVNEVMKVCFIPNFRVSNAQLIYPAAEISEQISTAGKEASGTSNMKLMMNGAITLGTLDGANIEIADLAGRENEAIFGLTAPEVEQLWASNSYFAWDTLNNDRERLGRVMDELKGNTFAGLSGNFESIYNELMNNNDPDLVMADFRSYVDAWEALTNSYGDQETWNRKALLNTASSGWFSSDRTIREYRDEIWHA